MKLKEKRKTTLLPNEINLKFIEKRDGIVCFIRLLVALFELHSNLYDVTSL